jgi:hypothetical protein
MNVVSTTKETVDSNERERNGDTQNEVIKKNKLCNLVSGLVKDAVFLLLQIQSLPLSENPITLLRIGHVL